MKEKFSITGMTCSACSSGIEKNVNKLKGVERADVSLMGESMTVVYDETLLCTEDIIKTVQSLGYGATRFGFETQNEKKPQVGALKKRFFLSLIFLLPLMYFSMGGMLDFLPQPSLQISATLQALLALGVIVVDFKFFTNGAKALLKRVPNMDTLVALGAGVSYVYSFVLTILIYTGSHVHAHLFFESAAMILALVTLGKWLEEKSKRKTGQEIEKLIKLMPNTVLIERDGVEEKVAFSDVKVGDLLIVKQGEYVPVDGKIVEGNAFIDRSALTGESMPIEVSVGDKITGADIVKSGYVKVLAKKVGTDTALSQIVKMVKEAGESKAPIQKIADRIAGVFVPAVALIAAFVFVLWFVLTGDIGKAANYGICVLVISCPCSLGLATPVAVMAATGRGMALGVLYKDAEALQKAKDVNCVLLDKTATLTIGKPKVLDAEVFDGDKDVALAIACAIETYSSHPIAECIKEYVLSIPEIETVKVENYAYATGKGATAVFGGKTYRLGNRRLLAGVDETKTYQLEKAYSMQGKTAIFLGDEKKLVAVFAVADTLKTESESAVSLLKEKGVRVGMLTGDNENVAKAIAGQVGITDYFAEALPEDKVNAVKRVQSVGGFVAMVGDGINDSPALKQADIGVAMGNGSDVAMDSADVVLSRGDLRLVATMVELSRKTVRNIKQNLFWAFFYNCLAIPLAAGVFAFAGISLTPMLGAACMSASSLFVVSNALRLTRFEKNKKNQEKKGMQKTLKVEGMMCPRCVAHVTKALEGVVGAGNVDVQLKKKTATVTLEKEIADETLVAAVTEAGYEVKAVN